MEEAVLKGNNNQQHQEPEVIAHKDGQQNDPSKNKENKDHNNVISYLLKQNLLTQDQVYAAEIHVKTNADKNINLIQALVDMGFITESIINEVLSSDNLSKSIDLKKIDIPSEIISKIPKDFAIKNKVVPIKEEEKSVVVATSDPYNIVVIDQLSQFFGGKEIITAAYSVNEINQAVDKFYKTFYTSNVLDLVQELESIIDTQSQHGSEDSPIVKFVDAIIFDAVKTNASDIHIEPDEFFVRVRYRIDGVMMDKIIVHKNYWSGISVRLKVIAGMNIAESRKTQDGAINMIIQNRPIDFRVSSLPTIYGENIVLRILDRVRGLSKLEDLGFNNHNIKILKLALEKPEGVVIVTGPTGSGKTTTLYSILADINSIHDNIMTLEEPVEYRLPIIRQAEINHRAGFDFASGLRAILRQDPDIIFLGEIRDEETANTAIRASITGHKVFSTLHTNNAITAITRLIDMGIKPFMLSGSLVAVISQRLVRKLCPYCKVKQKMSELMKATFMLSPDQEYIIYEAAGCDECSHIGYKGRIVVSEILFISEGLNMVISSTPNIKDITEAAKSDGFVSIQRDAILKVVQGFSSWDEIRSSIDMTYYSKRMEELKQTINNQVKR